MSAQCFHIVSAKAVWIGPIPGRSAGAAAGIDRLPGEPPGAL